MRWTTVKHKDLSDADKIRIATLKNQHWPYGIDSQLLWMEENIKMDDVHLLGEVDDGIAPTLGAYITLSNLKVTIDGKCFDFIGAGGVCVDKRIQHSGFGKQLMNTADMYIREQGKPGIFLCKDAVLGFYIKCGWKILHYDSALIAGKVFEHHIMLNDRVCSCVNIAFDRNF